MPAPAIDELGCAQKHERAHEACSDQDQQPAQTPAPAHGVSRVSPAENLTTARPQPGVPLSWPIQRQSARCYPRCQAIGGVKLLRRRREAETETQECLGFCVGGCWRGHGGSPITTAAQGSITPQEPVMLCHGVRRGRQARRTMTAVLIVQYAAQGCVRIPGRHNRRVLRCAYSSWKARGPGSG